MGEKMTLEQVRDRCISWLGDVACNGAVSGIAAKDIRAIFEPHLATPAQTVDVEKVKWVIAALKYMAQNGGVELDVHDLSIDCSKMADKLSQAIVDKT